MLHTSSVLDRHIFRFRMSSRRKVPKLTFTIDVLWQRICFSLYSGASGCSLPLFLLHFLLPFPNEEPTRFIETLIVFVSGKCVCPELYLTRWLSCPLQVDRRLQQRHRRRGDFRQTVRSGATGRAARRVFVWRAKWLHH